MLNCYKFDWSIEILLINGPNVEANKKQQAVMTAVAPRKNQKHLFNEILVEAEGITTNNTIFNKN